MKIGDVRWKEHAKKDQVMFGKIELLGLNASNIKPKLVNNGKNELTNKSLTESL